MGQEVVPMETKLAAMFASVEQGRESVTEVCARLGISRQTYYKYRRRLADEGLEGLHPRSRRPDSTPTMTPQATADLICRVRAVLENEGWDNGALSIHNRLLRDGVGGVPSWRTIHRVLVREQLVVPQPQKRPRSSRRRFEFPAPDDLWQIDAFEHPLADGTVVVVFEIKDDCSRTQIANLAWPREDADGAWLCLTRGIEQWGRPLLVLSDNSLAFNGRAHGVVVQVEKNLRALGIKPITCRPGHPQTNGKNERGHSTLQRWLRAQPPASTLAELQSRIERYQTVYNDRPHQGLDPNQTPLERRIAARRPRPEQGPIPEPTLVRYCTVKPRGSLSWDGFRIAVGAELAGRVCTVFATGEHLLIFYRHHLVRELVIDRSRRSQNLPEPRRRDANRQRLVDDLLATAPRPTGAGPRPAPLPAPGAVEAPGSRAAAGRRAAGAKRPLNPEERPRTISGAYTRPTTQLSAMSWQ
jgi:transposase InsO family protein